MNTHPRPAGPPTPTADRAVAPTESPGEVPHTHP